MKVLVCSDIHGNIRALEAVLAVYRKIYPCEFIFLGDAIGYGAHPDAVPDRILNLPRAVLLKGNHEQAFFDEREREEMNVLASSAIQWTEHMMGDRYDDVLMDRLQREYSDDRLIAALASPAESDGWPYIYSESSAEAVFYKIYFELCFIGHTHVPMVYTFNGGMKNIDPGEPLLLDPGERYIINPGSVGQPRDWDPRASFCVYDDEARTVTLHRREYDVEAEAEDIKKAGLPEYFGDRLLKGC